MQPVLRNDKLKIETELGRPNNLIKNQKLMARLEGVGWIRSWSPRWFDVQPRECNDDGYISAADTYWKCEGSWQAYLFYFGSL